MEPDAKPSSSREQSPQRVPEPQREDERDETRHDTQQPHPRGQLARRSIHPEEGLIQRQPMHVQHDGEQNDQEQEQGQGQTVAQPHHESDRGGAPAVRLDMDLDVDVQMKAKIKGDITLSILCVAFCSVEVFVLGCVLLTLAGGEIKGGNGKILARCVFGDNESYFCCQE